MEGPVAEADRVRFTWYARHIRTLHMDIARRIDPTVFEHLARAGIGSRSFRGCTRSAAPGRRSTGDSDLTGTAQQ